MDDMEPGFAQRWIDDYDRDVSELAGRWGPGSEAYESVVPQYDRQVLMAFDGSLSGRLGPWAKSVVINDYLPAGEMYVTDREIILSHKGWENLIKHLDRQSQCKLAVNAIVEHELGDVLSWLREAGHDV